MNPEEKHQAEPLPRQDMHIAEIRELARRFTPEELEGCIQQELADGENPCDQEGSIEETMNVLAKAEYVRHLVDQGTPLAAAIRELGRRIRAVQEGGA